LSTEESLESELQSRLGANFSLAELGPVGSPTRQFCLSQSGQRGASLDPAQGSQVRTWDLQAGEPLLTFDSGRLLDLCTVCDDGGIFLADREGIYRWRPDRATALETVLAYPEASRLLRGRPVISACGGHLIWEEIQPGRSGFLGLLSGHSSPEAHAQHYQPASQRLSSWPGYKVSQATPGQLLLRLSPSASKAAMLIRGPEGWSLGVLDTAREVLLLETKIHPQEESALQETPDLVVDDQGCVAIAFSREVQILKPTPEGLFQRTSASLRPEQSFLGFWGGWFFIHSPRQNIRLAWSAQTSPSLLDSPATVFQAYLLSGAERLTVGSEQPAQLHYGQTVRTQLSWWGDATRWPLWAALRSQRLTVAGHSFQIQATPDQVSVYR
jgi:hypothetical protein